MTCCYDPANQKMKIVFKELDHGRRPYICLIQNDDFDCDKEELAKVLYLMNKYCLSLDMCKTSRIYMSLFDLEDIIEKGRDTEETDPHYWISRHLSCPCDIEQSNSRKRKRKAC